MKLRAFLVAPVLAFVAGCQATSDLPKENVPAVNVPAGQQAVIENLVGSRCPIAFISRAHGEETRSTDAPIIGNSVTYGDDFWVQYDYTVRGVRDAAYHNIATGDLICGRTEWRRTDVFFAPEPHWPADSVAPPSKSQRDVETGFRSFELMWEGYAEAFLGWMLFKERKGRGRTFAELPDGDGRCYGSYQFDRKGHGVWSTACTNGLTAFGEFETDGRAGGEGVGNDAHGRDVRFTLGPLEPQS